MFLFVRLTCRPTIPWKSQRLACRIRGPISKTEKKIVHSSICKHDSSDNASAICTKCRSQLVTTSTDVKRIPVVLYVRLNKGYLVSGISIRHYGRPCCSTGSCGGKIDMLCLKSLIQSSACYPHLAGTCIAR